MRDGESSRATGEARVIAEIVDGGIAGVGHRVDGGLAGEATFAKALDVVGGLGVAEVVGRRSEVRRPTVVKRGRH